MKKVLKYVVLVTIISTLVSCAAPMPVIPDGNNRTRINSQESVEGYKYQIDNEVRNYDECTSLSRKYDSVLQQLAALKADMLVMQMTRISMQQPAVKSGSAPMQSVQDTFNEGETMEVRQNSILFRLSHPRNKASIKPSKALEGQLIRAARNAKRIEIRGRTDAQTDNAVDKYIASKRASNANLYLVRHGIDQSKISCSYLAAGDNIADNSSFNGRAKNRRVDIEVYPEATAIDNQVQGQSKIRSEQGVL